MKGLYKTLFLLFLTAAFLCTSMPDVGEAAGAKKGDASEWLHSLALPDAVRSEFLDKLSKASPGKAQGWVVSDAGAVYVLGAVPVPQDDEPELQVSLEAEALNRSALEAVTLMARHMAEGRLDKRKFEDEDAADYALGSYYREAWKGGAQSQSNVFGKMAVTLLWVDAALRNRLLAEALPEKRLTVSYCERLYQRGSELMQSGDYEGALSVFHKIHYLEWANVGAYLDAAECFLKGKKNGDAVLLLQELLRTLEAKMTPGEMARAGRLLFRGGNTEEGFAALERACIMAGILVP